MKPKLQSTSSMKTFSNAWEFHSVILFLCTQKKKNFLFITNGIHSVSEGVQGVPWLIFEFMHYGDLAGILLANSGVKSFNNDRLPTLSKVKILFDIVVSLDN